MSHAPRADQGTRTPADAGVPTPLDHDDLAAHDAFTTDGNPNPRPDEE